jgi:hypothetical protein
MDTSLSQFPSRFFIFIAKIVCDLKFVNAEILYGVRLKIPQSRTLSKKIGISESNTPFKC